MQRPFLLVPMIALLAAPLFDCATLPPLAANTCGNHVVETGEDCDGQSVGAATCTSTCRLQCPSPPDTCPEGWGCGVDGICRQPSGHFVVQGASIPAGAFRVATGDFDHDGLADALTLEASSADGFSKARIHFFDRHSNLVQVLAPPTTFGSPRIVDLNGDHLSDLLFLAYGSASPIAGIGAALGQADRTLLGVPYPFLDIRDVDMRFLPLVTDKGAVLFCVFANGEVPDATGQVQNFTGFLKANNTTTPERLMGTARGPANLAGPMTMLRVFPKDLLHDCPQIVFAFQGDTAATVVSACDRTAWDGWADPLLSVTVPYPPGIVAGSLLNDVGFRAADVDGDGNPDLIMPGHVDGGSSEGTFVALGIDGMSAFQPAQTFSYKRVLGRPDPEAGAPAPKGVQVEEGGLEVRDEGELGVVLAANDLNGDGLADFVLRDRIDLSWILPNPDHLYLEIQPRDHAWDEAVIADFNADGALDVFAGNSGAFDLDYFNGTGSNQLFQTSIATTGPPSHLVVGDFDGDRVQDLGFAVAGTQVAISYGQPRGYPTAPVLVGSFGLVKQTVSAYPSNDLLVEVELNESDGGAVGPKVESILTDLTGAGTRPPTSNFGLNQADPSTGIPKYVGAPLALLADTFTGASSVDGGAPLPDVVALAIDAIDEAQTNGPPARSSRLWLLPTRGPSAPASFAAAQPDPAALDPDFLPSTMTTGLAPPVRDVLVASGDVNGDGRPEVVAIARSSADATKCDLVIATVGATFGAVTTSKLSFPLGRGGKLVLSDFDGDGWADILVLNAGADATTPSQLIAVYNKGGPPGGAASTWQGFDVANSQILTMGDNPRDFVRVRLDAGPHPALVSMTSTTLSTLTFQSRSSMPTSSPLPLALAGDAGATQVLPPGLASVAAGDIDGDGVEDLVVILGDGSLQVLHDQPVNP